MSDAAQLWIKSGYELFALEGAEGIQIEKLARKVGKNKSGFYHYFGDRDVYLTHLLDYHKIQSRKFNSGIRKLNQFDPDFLQYLVDHKLEVLFQKRLRNHADNPVFQQVFLSLKIQNEPEILRLFSQYVDLPVKHPILPELLDVARDVLFLRLDVLNWNLKNMRDVLSGFSETMKSVRNISKSKDISAIKET